ncbi:hypothetical protein CBW18_14155 [Pedobacter sp. AJM]|nr:hypothetical protein CBW18_14155 [Pedobacter sp. AJM]
MFLARYVADKFFYKQTFMLSLNKSVSANQLNIWKNIFCWIGVALIGIAITRYFSFLNNQ